MKKLLAMVLAAVMVLSLCSCATAEETVALRVWVGDNADLPWINGVIENFKAAHPEKTYDISVDIQAEGDCSKRVLNDTEAAADVFTFADDQFNSLMNAEALQQVMVDADEIIAANGGANAGAVQASTGADGNLYAYPATADNGYFMFYNKEYFTEEDVQTLDGMLAKAAAAGKYVGFPMSDAWYLYSFFQGAGLEMHVTEDGVTNTCNWNATDTEITGVQVVEALLAITSNPGFREANSDPFVAGVKDGSIIAGVSGTWNAKVAQEAWGENYAACKLPTYTLNGEQVQMASFSGYKLVGVNPHSANVGVAMMLADYITNEDNQAKRFNDRQLGPSNIAVSKSEAVQSAPAIAALAEQSDYATLQRVGANYWSSAESLGEILASGDTQGKTTQQLVEDAVAGITAPVTQ